ncbi:MAG: hypothetical protein WEB13_06955 [Dehalococcoidia bacterium]
MEERRIREISDVVQQAFERREEPASGFASYLQDHGVHLVDVMEALEDVARIDPDEDAGLATLLRLAVERLEGAAGSPG